MFISLIVHFRKILLEILFLQLKSLSLIDICNDVFGDMLHDILIKKLIS